MKPTHYGWNEVDRVEHGGLIFIIFRWASSSEKGGFVFSADDVRHGRTYRTAARIDAENIVVGHHHTEAEARESLGQFARSLATRAAVIYKRMKEEL